jgi:class 3 adenylate cyclase
VNRSRPHEAPPTTGQSRTVREPAAVLVTDIANMSRFREVCGPEVAGRYRDAHEAVVTSGIRGNGGTIVKGTGDGALAQFENASDAIRAAVEIQRDLARLSSSGDPLNGIGPLPQGAKLPLVAIAVGCGTYKPTHHFERVDVEGPAVIDTFRVSRITEGGHILVSGLSREGARVLCEDVKLDVHVAQSERIWSQSLTSDERLSLVEILYKNPETGAFQLAQEDFLIPGEVFQDRSAGHAAIAAMARQARETLLIGLRTIPNFTGPEDTGDEQLLAKIHEIITDSRRWPKNGVTLVFSRAHTVERLKERLAIEGEEYREEVSKRLRDLDRDLRTAGGTVRLLCHDSFETPMVVADDRLAIIFPHRKRGIGDQAPTLRLQSSAAAELLSKQFIDAARKASFRLGDYVEPAPALASHSTARVSGLAEARDFLNSNADSKLELSPLEVVPGWPVSDRDSREILCDKVQDFRTHFLSGQGPLRPASYLVWAPPGVGKTTLFLSVADELRKALEVANQPALHSDLSDLADSKTTAASLRSTLEGFRGSVQPGYLIVDEVASKAEERWPYEMLAPFMWENTQYPRLVVLIGSSPGGIEVLKNAIRTYNGEARFMGSDLISRVGPNEIVLPPLTALDKVLVALSAAVPKADPARGVNSIAVDRQVEESALWWICSNSGFDSRRAIGTAVAGALKRAATYAPGGNRLKLIDFFGPDGVPPEFKSTPEYQRYRSRFITVRPS